MANPLIAQGSLNRLLASVVFSGNALLNVTSPFLAKEAIRIALEGKAAMQIPTLTGLVNSPEPYRIAIVTINLLKSQFLSVAFKQQEENNTSLGLITVIPDSITFIATPYQFDSCVLEGVNELTFDGNVPGFQVTIRGRYNVNSSLWNLNF